MRTKRNILIAFLLNLLFALVEFVGGALTGSVAILSDAVHDLGDAAGIGFAFFLERKSGRPPDAAYTYGYARYSVVGSALTTLILLLGCGIVITRAMERLLSPIAIHYDGMIALAVLGIVVNLVATLVTRAGDSLNQKAVNLHMLEDVLGWIAVLIGAVIMRFTDFWFLDPLLSLGVAAFILVNALRNLRETLHVLLEKSPPEISVSELQTQVCEIDGVQDVHHIHVWSLDGRRHCATMHVVAEGDPHVVKNRTRQTLAEHGISHATVELETTDEPCRDILCSVQPSEHLHHHHHHH